MRDKISIHVEDKKKQGPSRGPKTEDQIQHAICFCLTQKLSKNNVQIFKWLKKVKRKIILCNTWKYTKFKFHYLYMKYYWNTATLIYVLPMANIVLQWQIRIVATDIPWPTKPKIFNVFSKYLQNICKRYMLISHIRNNDI